MSERSDRNVLYRAREFSALLIIFPSATLHLVECNPEQTRKGHPEAFGLLFDASCLTFFYYCIKEEKFSK